MSRKRRGSNGSLEYEEREPRRRKGIRVPPAAVEEDMYLDGDPKRCRVSDEPAEHWTSAPTLDRAYKDTDKHRRLQLKTVFMLTSWGNNSSQSPGQTEMELLEACELGELKKVKNLLYSEDPVNVNCVDILGRTPLLITMERDNLQMMDLLIHKSSKKNMDTVLLHAINQCKETIATAILRHPRYVQAHKINLKRIGTHVGITDGDYPMTSNFYLDTTPLILASQKNLFAVVKLLLLRGELIIRPHPSCCSCCVCDRREKRDRLRFAHRRLNTYRGLASESYVTLASEDPFKEAFDLRQEVIDLTHREKYFKEEYLTLARQLGVYVVRLLNEIRGSAELDLVLDKVDGDNLKSFEPLARMRRAIHIGMKKFVTHPSCQMKLTELWYTDCRFLQKSDWLYRFLIFVLFMFIYPFLAVLYLFIPDKQFLKVMKTPAVRFTAQAYSFFLFLVAIAGWSLNYDPGFTVQFEFKGNNVSHMFKSPKGSKPGYLTREYQLDGYEVTIFIWTVGLLWMKCEDLYRRGFKVHFSTIYNALDWVVILMYLLNFSLGYVVVCKCHDGVRYFETVPDAFLKLQALDQEALENFYWITPDRYIWNTWDPEHISEAAFAIANVLTFSRISYLLAANELLGPLQISLGRMTYDILRFTVIFVIIQIAFIIGIDNLLWHYEDSIREQVQLHEHTDVCKAGANFGNVEKTFRSVFWVTFGLVEYDVIDMHPYTNYFTQNIAYILLGAYMVAVGLVMLNMLIAMMSRSFDQIAQDGDIEFKFARSKLYLEYIEGGSPLPVPFNMLPTTKTITKLIRKIPLLSGLIKKTETPQSFPNENSDEKINLKRFKKSSSKAIFAEVQSLSYQDIIKKIVDRYISELSKCVDDDTDIQNAAEIVRNEIKNFHEATELKFIGAQDCVQMKESIIKLSRAMDQFIKMQAETTAVLLKITETLKPASANSDVKPQKETR